MTLLHTIHFDSKVVDTLQSVLDGDVLSVKGADTLYNCSTDDSPLIGMTADLLRGKSVGDLVTYVVNRNINFTNVCVKQCGFCAFSRDFRDESEAYMLPTSEIVRRAQEAYSLGATEVCIQAGLAPDMPVDTYEDICRAIKSKMPDIHIHGFSPEEILYGATNSGVSIREYLSRLKDAGVDTLPGTSAEILDQGIRDKISPGRISVEDWEHVIKTAHKMGIRTTSTMMYGHIESSMDRVKHIARIRDIQTETGGFTEFVPLSFIHNEAPMYTHHLADDLRAGPTVHEVLLTHAISRIMLYGSIPNIQMSWVKEGMPMSQMLLLWGANDFGGTLMNESISTSAGSEYGQLLRPQDIRHLVTSINRIPAERSTTYDILKTFEGKPAFEKLNVVDSTQFGSFFNMIKSKNYRYVNPKIK